MATRKTDAEKMELLGFQTAAEYPLHVPENYHDYTSPKQFVYNQIDQGKQLFKLKMMRDPDINDKKTPHIIKLYLNDGKGMVYSTIFGHKFSVRDLKKGDDIYLKGEAVKDDYGNLTIKSPEIIHRRFANQIIPRYRGKTTKDESDVEGKKRRAIIKEERVFQLVREQVQYSTQMTVDLIIRKLNDTEKNILEKTAMGYESLNEWLKQLHFPKTMYEAQRATEMSYRIASHEVYLRSQRLNESNKSISPKSKWTLPREVVVEEIKKIPFKLTNDQLRAISDVVKDIRSEHPMYRLLSGDVGVGKTLAFLIPALAAQKEGAKVAIMVPNIALCSNLHSDIKTFFPDAPVFHLYKGIKKKDVDISNNPIIIGTQTLLFSKANHLADWVPDLMIVDEQQKLSREQRELLKENHTNFLEATATAIPQTLAMISHGGMDYSSIEECPVEKVIHTSLVVGQEDSYQLMQNALKSVLKNGDQAALIYPLVKSEDETKRTVEQRYEQFEKIFPGRVAMLHGKMKDVEKMQVIDDMKAKKYDLLISSTVIEVGVTMPSVKFLGVVSPDRYGTSQLHQMRGRVSRSGGEGYFFMYVPEDEKIKTRDDLNPDTLKRLLLLEKYKHNEGFKLSEADMELRGFGDILDDKEKQNGKSSTLFPSIKLMPIHLRKYKEQTKLELIKEKTITIKRKNIDLINQKPLELPEP